MQTDLVKYIHTSKVGGLEYLLTLPDMEVDVKDKKGGGDILISKEESGSHLQQRGIGDIGDVQKS